MNPKLAGPSSSTTLTPGVAKVAAPALPDASATLDAGLVERLLGFVL